MDERDFEELREEFRKRLQGLSDSNLIFEALNTIIGLLVIIGDWSEGQERAMMTDLVTDELLRRIRVSSYD